MLGTTFGGVSYWHSFLTLNHVHIAYELPRRPITFSPPNPPKISVFIPDSISLRPRCRNSTAHNSQHARASLQQIPDPAADHARATPAACRRATAPPRRRPPAIPPAQPAAHLGARHHPSSSYPQSSTTSRTHSSSSRPLPPASAAPCRASRHLCLPLPAAHHPQRPAYPHPLGLSVAPFPLTARSCTLLQTRDPISCAGWILSALAALP